MLLLDFGGPLAENSTRTELWSFAFPWKIEQCLVVELLLLPTAPFPESQGNLPRQFMAAALNTAAYPNTVRSQTQALVVKNLESAMP